MTRQSQKALTLAELMVVIGIIGILFGLIIGPVMMVRESALQVACQSNLRQVGIAATMFADEEGGRYPASSNHGERNPEKSPAWFYRLPDYIDLPDTRGRHTVFQCPQYVWKDPEIFDHASPKSYKLNAYLSRDGRPQRTSIFGIRDAHEVVFFADAVAKETGMGQWGHLVASGVDWDRHHDQCCVLFLDGHSQKVVEKPASGDARDVLKFKSKRWK